MPGSQSKHLVVLPADLVQVLQRCGIGDDHVHQRRQIGYLSGYLGDIGAKTAVIENEYIDRDFLEDHVLYYSRCFHDYNRKCHRVHFFSKVYSEEDIDEIIVGGNADGFQDFTASYLGFVVIRPLPETIVGRTCLVPYVENGATDRHYKALCDTGVSFFGRKLCVHCMPFQEQDLAVAACATCALWAAFYVTANRFGHMVHSPAHITALATEHGLSFVRRIPNRNGLLVSDMVYAIRHVGLDPICIDVRNSRMLQQTIALGNIYAYLGLGVSVVAIGMLIDARGVSLGLHAVAINGYHLRNHGSGAATSVNGLYACEIDKLYVHDDQLGPYARVDVKNPNWVTQWKDLDGGTTSHEFLPQTLLIPVYHKIRVCYEEVWRCAYSMGQAIKALEISMGIKLGLTWDIVLSASNEFKDCVRKDSDIEKADKLRFLKTGLPRYIWNVTACLNGERRAIFCIDATDAGQGLRVAGAVFYSSDILDLVKIMSSSAVGLSDNPLYKACSLIS